MRRIPSILIRRNTLEWIFSNGLYVKEVCFSRSGQMRASGFFPSFPPVNTIVRTYFGSNRLVTILVLCLNIVCSLARTTYLVTSLRINELSSFLKIFFLYLHTCELDGITVILCESTKVKKSQRRPHTCERIHGFACIFSQITQCIIFHVTYSSLRLHCEFCIIWYHSYFLLLVNKSQYRIWLSNKVGDAFWCPLSILLGVAWVLSCRETTRDWSTKISTVRTLIHSQQLATSNRLSCAWVWSFWRL